MGLVVFSVLDTFLFRKSENTEHGLYVLCAHYCQNLHVFILAIELSFVNLEVKIKALVMSEKTITGSKGEI